MSRPALGHTQPPVQRVSCFFSGVKRPERGVNHSSPSRAEFRNEWCYTTTPPVCLYSMERKNLTFVFLSAIRLPVQGGLQVGD